MSRGFASGLAATLLLSALSRVLPGMRERRVVSPSTPAEALAEPVGPGPEAIAEQFAFKAASGLFGRDLTPLTRQAGLATHLLYGSMLGSLYGLLQSSYHFPTGLSGSLYGLAVYALGPGWLVPAMKLARPPREEPPVRTAMQITGHLAYGLALAATFAAIEKLAREEASR